MATRGLPAWPLIGTEADSLPEAERLVLDAARAWAAPGPAGPMAEAALVLAAAGVEGVALPFDAALRTLPGLRLQWLLCPNVSRAEATLLMALASAQAGRRAVALALLHRIAPPLSAYRAVAELSVMGCVLRRGGVSLTAPL
jgi:hypothetical protein